MSFIEKRFDVGGYIGFFWKLGRWIALGRYYINLFLSIIKWPVALAMMLVVPAAFQTFRRYYVIRDQLNDHNLLYFVIGIGFFAVVRVFFIIKRGTAETMEHEMTHSVFAMLTLHPVQHLEISDDGGGNMTFSGRGNWLIAIAPYFFPLTAFAMMLLISAVSRVVGHMPDWAFIGMGTAVCYNICSFAEQLHPRQTDFKVVGYLFTICFLPGANCLTFGTVFAFVERGFDGIVFFYRLIWYYARQDFMALLSYF